jgi:hypothetical protein
VLLVALFFVPGLNVELNRLNGVDNLADVLFKRKDRMHERANVVERGMVNE